MMLLEGRIALITGGGRGIGAASSKLLAKHGAAVAVNYVNNDKAANDVVNEINAHGGKAIAVQADVTDYLQVKKMVEHVEKTLGNIDTLVLNASIRFPQKPFLEFEWEEFVSKYVGEMKAAWNCCKLVLPSMLEKKKGCIIAVSSGLSRRSGRGFIAHSAAKAALNSFAKSLAVELSPLGIRINVVAPGLTLTDAIKAMPEERINSMSKMIPMQRVGMPEDIAGGVLLMASDYSKFITGAYLPVDGGMTML
jgi:3-oxoacyl-[acyl-carrier protein] reductase